MVEAFTAFLSSYERRSVGALEQRRTWQVQAASALLFGALAPLTATRPWVLLMFAAEACGQALLAFDGWRRRDEARVVYFRRTPVGLLAAWVFAAATVARALLVLEWAVEPSWEFVVLAGLIVLHVAPMAFPGRLDWPLGMALAGSALVLGVTLVSRGLVLPALSQLAYAVLLGVGACALRPSHAEALNLAVFSSALSLAYA